MTIKPEVRARVIELAKQGLKRDDIQQNIGNISTGSIRNILEAYRSRGAVKAQDQTSIGHNESVLQKEQQQVPPDASIITDDDIMPMSFSRSGDWHVNSDGNGSSSVIFPSSSSSSVPSRVVVPRHGGPLLQFSHFLNEDMAAEPIEVETESPGLIFSQISIISMSIRKLRRLKKRNSNNQPNPSLYHQILRIKDHQ